MHSVGHAPAPEVIAMSQVSKKGSTTPSPQMAVARSGAASRSLPTPVAHPAAASRTKAKKQGRYG
jgi:hypothetical protein